jgi:hypothetical protein
MQAEYPGEAQTGTRLVWMLCALILCAKTFAAWESVELPPGGTVLDFKVVGNRNLILTAAGIYAREPGQNAWSNPILPCQYRVDQLHAHGNVVIVNTSIGEPCLSRDGGKTWKSVDAGPVKKAPDYPFLFGVVHFGPEGLYVSAADPDFVLFRSQDTGRTWIRLSQEPGIHNLVPTGTDFLLPNAEGGVDRMNPVSGQITSASAGLPKAENNGYYLVGKAPGVILAGTGEEGAGVYRYLSASNRWELLLSDRSLFFPLVANDSTSVFLLLHDSSGSKSIWHSNDGGGTWDKKTFGGEMPSRIWAIGDELVYGYPGRSLVRRKWEAWTEVIWEEGIDAIVPYGLRLQGKILYACADHFVGCRRSWNRGKTWEAFLDSSVSEYLFLTGNQAYVNGVGYVDRLDPIGLGRRRIMATNQGNNLHHFIDAGTQFYAVSITTQASRPWKSWLYTSPQSPFVWSDAREIPLSFVNQFAASGETVVAGIRDTLIISNDGGGIWYRLFPQLPSTPASAPLSGSEYHTVRCEAGVWTLSNSRGVFQATDPQGIWNRIQSPLDSIREYRVTGARLLVSDATDAFYLTSDRGRTWKAFSFPVTRDQLSEYTMSDSMVCMSSYTQIQCLELDPLPTGIASHKPRVSRGLHSRLRRSGKPVFTPQQLLGRQVTSRSSALHSSRAASWPICD